MDLRRVIFYALIRKQSYLAYCYCYFSKKHNLFIIDDKYITRHKYKKCGLTASYMI